MASSDFWQKLSSSLAPPAEWERGAAAGTTRGVRGKVKFWMALDALTVFVSAGLATLYKLRRTPIEGVRGFWQGTLIHGRSTGILLALLCGYIVALIITNRRLHLYTPTHMTNFLHEQRMSAQACFTSGLLLTGTLYMVQAEDIPRAIVLGTIVLVAIALGLRRLVYRIFLYWRFDRGLDTRNVLIVGTGLEAYALRKHLEKIRHLGYTFKGFVELPGTSCYESVDAADIVGNLDTLFLQTRKQFIDEIFFATPCESGIVHKVLGQARIHGVDLRVVPDLYDGLAWNSPIEYIGQFPTIPLHHGAVPEIGLIFKRVFDMAFSALAVLALSPLLLVTAIAIKMDSPGPVFYTSERIGKKGVVFRCIKFRTMVRDADKHRAEVMHMNERDDVLFKIINDPRITRIGSFLRRYSLDELPQFFNVLRGDMSVVGPRPPLAGEVRKYDLSHLRRLDVTPGITGLWQVQGRQDPSFASYVSLDVAYIENWSIWLDFKIIMRTIAVVFAGTGA
ncbi:MAG: sugar transferase [Terracidiphilus sp.]|jgi:exopolysaccharide biosynthesis polyprenyl glycosylphosphotransferase